MPVDGVLRKMVYIPGDLFSVNPLTAQNVPNSLPAMSESLQYLIPKSVQCRWYRWRYHCCEYWHSLVGDRHTSNGRTDTTLVLPDIRPEAIRLNKGEEMGHFKLGSTVVMTFAKGAIEFDEALQPGSVTRMGSAMAKVRS